MSAVASERSSGSADSSVDAVLAYARERIISGEFAPGAKLLPKVLTEQCQTSLIPVREALRALEAEGLVTIIRNRGAWIAPLSLGDLRDLYSVRIPLETGAILEARPFDEDDISRLEGILDDACAAMERGDQRAIIQSNRDLHFTIYRHCDSPWRMRIIEQLWAHSERYQRVALDFRDDAADTEHRGIVRWLSKGDLRAAADELGAHLSTTVEVLTERLRRSGLPADH